MTDSNVKRLDFLFFDIELLYDVFLMEMKQITFVILIISNKYVICCEQAWQE